MGCDEMAIYDKNDNILTVAYNSSDEEIETAYDRNDNVVFVASEQEDTDAYINGRILVWEESFVGESGNAPDTTYWSHEVGTVRGTSWEKEYYTDGSDNSYLDGQGHLVIQARNETTENRTWSSASINTNNKYEFTYGRIEAKLKLPYQSGCVPAFWLLGACIEVVPLGYYDATKKLHNIEKGIRTPLTPEIDIMEQFGMLPTIQSAVHLGSEEDGNYEVHYMKTLTVDDTTDWHVYAVEWTSNLLIWYVDDVEVGRSTTPQSYPMLNKPMYILLNLAIGSVNNSGSPNASNKEMIADWVRVYLPEGVLEKYPVKSVSLSQQSLELTEGDTSIIDFAFTPSLCWNKTLIWTSSNTSIAEVYGGKVYAISKGTCTITATAHNGISASCIVTVNASS